MASRSLMVLTIIFVATSFFSTASGVEDKGIMLVKRTPRLINPKHRRQGRSESLEDPFRDDDLDLSAVDQSATDEEEDLREPESEARLRTFDAEDLTRASPGKQRVKDGYLDAEAPVPQLAEVFDSIESRVKKAQAQQKPVVFGMDKKKKARNKGSNRRRTDLNKVDKNSSNQQQPPPNAPIIPAQPAVILSPIAPIPIPAPVVPVPVLPSMPAGVVPVHLSGSKKRSRLMHGQQGPDGSEAWGGDPGHPQRMVYMVPGGQPPNGVLQTPEEMDIQMLQELFAEPTTRIIEIVGDRPGKVLPPEPSPTYQRVMQEAERRRNDPGFPIRSLRNATSNTTDAAESSSTAASKSSPGTTGATTASTSATTTTSTKILRLQSTTTSTWARRVAELHERLTGSRKAAEESTVFKKSLARTSNGNAKVLQLYHPLAMQFLESPAGQSLFPYVGFIDSGGVNGRIKRPIFAGKSPVEEGFAQNEVNKRHVAQRKPSVFFAIAPEPAAAAPVLEGMVMDANAIGNPRQLAEENRVLALPPPVADFEAEARMAKPYQMSHTREKKDGRKRNKRSAEESESLSGCSRGAPSDRTSNVNLTRIEDIRCNVPPDISTIPLLEYVKKRNLEDQQLPNVMVSSTTMTTVAQISTTEKYNKEIGSIKAQQESREMEVRARWHSSSETSPARKSRQLSDVDLERVRVVNRRGIDSGEMSHVKSCYSARSQELLTPKLDDGAPPLEYTFVLNLMNRPEDSSPNRDKGHHLVANSRGVMVKPSRVKLESFDELTSARQYLNQGRPSRPHQVSLSSIQNLREPKTDDRHVNQLSRENKNVGEALLGAPSQDKLPPGGTINEDKYLPKSHGLVKAELIALGREGGKINRAPGLSSEVKDIDRKPGQIDSMTRKDGTAELREYLALLDRMSDDQVVQVAETIAKASENGDQYILQGLSEKADVICKLPSEERAEPAGRVVTVKMSKAPTGTDAAKPESKPVNEFPLEGFLTSMFRDFLTKKHKEFQRDMLEASVIHKSKIIPFDWPAGVHETSAKSYFASSEKSIQNLGRSSSEAEISYPMRSNIMHNGAGRKASGIFGTIERANTRSHDKVADTFSCNGGDTMESFASHPGKEENDQLISKIVKQLSAGETNSNGRNSPPKGNTFVLTASKDAIEDGKHSPNQDSLRLLQIPGSSCNFLSGRHYSGRLSPQAARRFLQAIGETLVVSKSKAAEGLVASGARHSFDLKEDSDEVAAPVRWSSFGSWRGGVENGNQRRRMSSSSAQNKGGGRTSCRTSTSDVTGEQVDLEITLQLPKELGDPKFLDTLNAGTSQAKTQ